MDLIREIRVIRGLRIHRSGDLLDSWAADHQSASRSRFPVPSSPRATRATRAPPTFAAVRGAGRCGASGVGRRYHHGRHGAV